MLLMGKSTISSGPFSIANCLFTRGYIPVLIWSERHPAGDPTEFFTISEKRTSETIPILPSGNLTVCYWKYGDLVRGFPFFIAWWIFPSVFCNVVDQRQRPAPGVPWQDPGLISNSVLSLSWSIGTEQCRRAVELRCYGNDDWWLVSFGCPRCQKPAVEVAFGMAFGRFFCCEMDFMCVSDLTTAFHKLWMTRGPGLHRVGHPFWDMRRNRPNLWVMRRHRRRNLDILWVTNWMGPIMAVSTHKGTPKWSKWIKWFV